MAHPAATTSIASARTAARPAPVPRRVRRGGRPLRRARYRSATGCARGGWSRTRGTRSRRPGGYLPGGYRPGGYRPGGYLPGGY
ncbi:MAG: hypothetical protein ACHP9Z_13030, partial [Streptosporangiales bacterium]